MKSKSELKCFYFWVKISGAFIKILYFTFCNLAGKVFKINGFYISYFTFDAAYSTSIHFVVYTYKTR